MLLAKNTTSIGKKVNAAIAITARHEAISSLRYGRIMNRKPDSLGNTDYFVPRSDDAFLLFLLIINS